jgi:diaminopimelate epimerase
MHGIGNDYIYIDALESKFDTVSAPSIARRLSDRHFGVGGDGLVVIAPAKDADAQMRIFNADGSEAQMCGNAIRCVAKYLRDHHLRSKTAMEIDTLSGKRRLRILKEEKDTTWVEVDMGVPILDSKMIPVVGDNRRVVDEPFYLEQDTLNITCVSMGNPHCIIFIDDIAKAPVNTIGPLLESHPYFPQRINVEFVQIVDSQHIKMRVWERGSGETMACGTGASASVVASVLNKKCFSEVEVELIGGELDITWAKDDHVYMTGPAVEVFEGRLTTPIDLL